MLLTGSVTVIVPSINSRSSVSETFIFFFFQAEDGIRDVAVTGVQTCALPISGHGIYQLAYSAIGHCRDRKEVFPIGNRLPPQRLKTFRLVESINFRGHHDLRTQC